MEAFYNKFRELIETESKNEAIEFALALIDKHRVTIVEFYEEILARTMNSIECHNDEKNLCVWREHVRSGIARTIIESLYSRVLAERSKNHSTPPDKKVAVICPDGEYHDMGARIVSDYFTLLNWDVVFVGNSTPKDEFIRVAEHLNLNAIAISVTNPYNLVSAKKTIDMMREKCDENLKIFVGGYGFTKVDDIKKDFNVDGYVSSFNELKNLLEGGEY
ncbi:cobalamin-dependent protein [Alkalibacter sp. M17DMB]|nr:cobalamin-dependent protein [Alkalibacter mobilis]